MLVTKKRQAGEQFQLLSARIGIKFAKRSSLWTREEREKGFVASLIPEESSHNRLNIQIRGGCNLGRAARLELIATFARARAPLAADSIKCQPASALAALIGVIVVVT